MTGATVPEKLHICPGCAELCEGAEFCFDCRELHAELESAFHARRAAELYGSLPRERGTLPEGGLEQLRRQGLGLALSMVFGAAVWAGVVVLFCRAF